MTFIHPGVLIAAVLGLLPIIIYYLMRFRSLRVQWGADYILERALNRLKKRLYLDQVILLALRVLAVVALVVAFARPVSRQASATVTGSGVLRVLVVDASYSMLAGDGRTTRWEKSVTMMRRLVSSWGRGELWSLYVADGNPRWILDRVPVESAESSAAALERLRAVETHASLGPALETVLARCADTDLEIYIAADDQATTWDGVETVLAGIDAQRTRVFWLNSTLGGYANAAVTSVRVASEKVVVGHPCHVFAEVRNYGSDPVRDLRTAVLLDESAPATEDITLLPGQSGWIHLETKIDKPGSRLVTARIAHDCLPFDDEMSAGVEVVSGLRVMVLRDRELKDKFRSSWGFLDLAARSMVAPASYDAAPFTGGRFEVILNEDNLTVESLDQTDVVILDSGRTVTPELAAALKNFVAGGGGLILAADDAVDVSAWNRLLGQAELLPAGIGAARTLPLAGETWRAVSRNEFGAPALRAFERSKNGDISALRFYSWMEVEPPQAPAVVLARFDNGDPYVLERRGGRGAVLLLTAGLNARYNNLFVREPVYAFLMQLFSEAASGAIYQRTVSRGMPVRCMVTGPEPLGAEFSQGDTEPTALSPEKTADGNRFTSPDTDRTGPASILALYEDGHRRTWFGVQGERSDSDLLPAERALFARMAETLPFHEAASWEELDEALTAARGGNEWYHWVMIAACVLLVGEMLMEQRFV